MTGYLLGSIHIQETIKKVSLFSDGYYVSPSKQVEYLRNKANKLKEDYEKMSAQAKVRAFTVAAVTEKDSIEKVKKFLEDTINEGESYTDLLKRIDAEKLLDAAGIGNNAWYWETVHRTNQSSAYNAGRLMEIQDNITDVAYLEFVGIDDDRQSEICAKLDGTILPADHPFWDSHTPPLHYNCRSTLRPIMIGTAEASKVKPADRLPDVEADKGFRLNPTGSSWQPGRSLLEKMAETQSRKSLDKLNELIDDYARKYATDYEAFMKSAYGLDDVSVAGEEYRAWRNALDKGKTSKMIKAVGYIDEPTRAALSEVGVEVKTPVAFTSDKKVVRSQRDVKVDNKINVPDEELDMLPERLEKADKYLDTRNNDIIYFWGEKDGYIYKAVATPNYNDRGQDIFLVKSFGKVVMNSTKYPYYKKII